jgi:glycosyltransferase involved in cell wall biosynthesis
MNFSIILIVKNEEHNIDHLHNDLINFMNDGGEVIIVDTGSSDLTVEKARSLGFRVERSQEELTRSISEEDMKKIHSYLKDELQNVPNCFFDFAKARNYAHTFAKNDMILQLDASHHLINFDYKKINDRITSSYIKFFEYEALWFKDEGSEGIINMQERFYNRKYFSWTNYVHECIVNPTNVKKEKLEPSELLIHHVAGQKVRNYLSGLFAYHLNHPEDARNISYLSRELMYIGCYKTSLYFLEIYLTYNNVWVNEKSNAYVMMGKCYEKLNDNDKAILSYNQAHEICKIWREPLICLSQLYLKKKQYYDVILQCQKAIRIENANAYIEDYPNYTYLPHQLIVRACKFLIKDIHSSHKYAKLGHFHTEKCIQFNKNLKYMKDFFLPYISSEISKGDTGLLKGDVEKGQKTVAIYLSYCSLKGNKGGSEIAAENLALSLSKKNYRVFLLSIDKDTRCVDNVTYMHYDSFQELDIELDILIISRYINYFIDFDFKPKKTYLWFHDTLLCYYYRGLELNNKGSYLFKHVKDKIDGIIVLTDWHKDKITSEYPFVKNVTVINYGIGSEFIQQQILRDKAEVEQIIRDKAEGEQITRDKAEVEQIIRDKAEVEQIILDKAEGEQIIRDKAEGEQITRDKEEGKVKNRFIYTSAFNRGIVKLVDYFHEIVKQVPDAELHIFRDYTGYENYVEEWKKYPYIKVYGNVDNKRIIDEFMISSVWFYPTDWEETYCLSALEAQLTKTLCICTNLAALKNVVGDRGILFDKSMKKEECVNLVVSILKDEEKEKVNMLIEKAYKWALEQHWDTKVHEWLNLFSRE